jgi:hypothetical protein
MTERDAAWMARIISRITPAQLHAIAVGGRFADPTDADYISRVLVARQRIILSRYLTRLSPIADVRVDADGAISATDLAVASAIPEATRASFRVVQRGAQPRQLAVEVDRQSGHVRFVPVSVADQRLAEDDPRRLTVFEVSDGIAAPLEIHAYDLGRRGFRVVGLVRPSR